MSDFCCGRREPTLLMLGPVIFAFPPPIPNLQCCGSGFGRICILLGLLDLHPDRNIMYRSRKTSQNLNHYLKCQKKPRSGPVHCKIAGSGSRSQPVGKHIRIHRTTTMNELCTPADNKREKYSCVCYQDSRGRGRLQLSLLILLFLI